MAVPSERADELAELIARRFRLLLPAFARELLATRERLAGLAEPMRIRIFDRLRDGEATVHELASELGTSQQNVSKHLALMADAGAVARLKEGNRAYYRIVDEGVVDLCEQVSSSVERHLQCLLARLQEAVAAQPRRST